MLLSLPPIQTALIGAALFCWFLAWCFCRAAAVDRELSKPLADRMWAKVEPTLKPYPGTMAFPGVNVPSVERDVEQERLARQARRQRALTQPMHTRWFSIEATNDSEAATEVMQKYVGSLEIEAE